MYLLVYMLLKLLLILPIVTATEKRVFSIMSIVKNRLQNKMEDTWKNNCLVTYIEKNIQDRKSTRLNSVTLISRMPSSA